MSRIHARYFTMVTLNWLFFSFIYKLTTCGENRVFPTSIYVKWFLTWLICEVFCTYTCSCCIFCLQKRSPQRWHSVKIVNNCWHLFDIVFVGFPSVDQSKTRLDCTGRSCLLYDWLKSLENQQKVKTSASRNGNVTQVYFLSFKYNFLIFFVVIQKYFS